MVVAQEVMRSGLLMGVPQHHPGPARVFVQDSCSRVLCVARPGLDVRYNRIRDPDESSDHSLASVDHSASSLICCDMSSILIVISN
jgi:hypothetical protein